CNRYHPRCTVLELPELPKRVLDLHGREQDNIKLLELNGVYAPYVALSYCWGADSEGMLKTTTASLREHQRGIPWDAFPKTFQDAIRICFALKIRYLWIDALSIVQDDEEDWEIESSKMASIYSNSRLTIAATSSADNKGGLFNKRWTSLLNTSGESVRVPRNSVALEFGPLVFRLQMRLHLAHDRFINMNNARNHNADAPLMTRAWAFQERLLPSRTLHVHAEELVWECKTDLRCECGRLDDPSIKEAEAISEEAVSVPYYSRIDEWGETLKSLFAVVDVPGAPEEKLAYIWIDLVSEFSRLDLTYESDRLPALSGLAAKFMNTALGDYVAGMWIGALSQQLLYETLIPPEAAAQDGSYRPQAPSWSWASIPLVGENGISYKRLLQKSFVACPQFEYVNHTCKILGKNRFGWVKWATLTVKGKCIDCFAVRTFENTWHLSKRRLSLQRFTDLGEFPRLLVDGTITVKYNSRLVFLHVGSQLGLALAKCVSDDGVEYFQRVGLVSLPDTSNWLLKVKVRQIDIR
ncbi:HET-domain-containing protein, partial [Lojkania enalia]